MTLPILAYGYLASTFVPAVTGAVRYRKLEKGMKMLAFLAILGCAQAMLAYGLSLARISNYTLSNTYRPVELALIAVVLYYLTQSQKARRVIALCAYVYVIVWIADKIFIEDPTQINNRMAVLSRTAAMIMTVVAMYSAWKVSNGRMSELPLFWVGAGIVLYSASTLVLLGWSNVLTKLATGDFMFAWQINWVMLIVYNSLFTKGLLCSSPR